METQFNTNPKIDLTRINDSMELDSGQCLASLKVNGYEITLEVRGSVNVTYNPNSETTYEGGDVYRYASDFPTDLLQMFHDGKTADAPNVYVDENNWFEVFVEKDGKFIDSEVIDAEGMNPAELFSMLWETYQDYVKDSNDEQARAVCYGRDDLLAVAEAMAEEYGGNADGEELCAVMANAAVDFLKQFKASESKSE